MNEIYNLSNAARVIGIPGLGRNKLYRILKLIGIVDHRNRPEQKYVDDGLLTQPTTNHGGLMKTIKRNVTLVQGYKGLRFIKETVLEYVKDNPMPKFPHRRKMISVTDT